MAPFRWRAPLAGLLMAAVLSVGGTALAAETRPQGIGPRPPAPTGVVVNLPARTLYWYVNGQVARVFPVGVGKEDTQTVTGSFHVLAKEKNPTWYPPWNAPPVPPGPDNPLGTRWINFYSDFGIHGNAAPNSIGGVVSHGCIRMYNADVEWLYDQVTIGTPVTVQYQTVQMLYGNDGRQYLAVYDDIYGEGRPTAAGVLTAADVEADAVKPDGPGLYALDAQALVNGQPAPAILHKGRAYVAARVLGSYTGTVVSWDPTAGTVLLDGQSVSTVVRGSMGYVDAEAAASVLGLDYTWHKETGTALLTGTPLFLSGHLLNQQGTALDDGETKLPVDVVRRPGGTGRAKYLEI